MSDEEAPVPTADEIQDLIHFECVITSLSNIRVLSQAFLCMAKLGKEVTIEATKATESKDHQMTFRSVNDSKTSFVAFEFRGDFFESFSVGEDEENREGFAAQLKLRSCLAVFRTTKTMERLTISLATMREPINGKNSFAEKHVVAFRAQCKNFVTKSHNFYYEEAEAVDPEFDREEAKHKIRSPAKVWHDCLHRIVGTDTIVMNALPGNGLEIASHHGMGAASTAISTEITRSASDFHQFDISSVNAKLIFSVRELRALIAFCESSTVLVNDIRMYFNDIAEPLMITSLADPNAIALGNHAGSGLPGDMMQMQEASSSFGFTLVLSTIPDNIAAEGSAQEDEATFGRQTSFVSDT